MLKDLEDGTICYTSKIHCVKGHGVNSVDHMHLAFVFTVRLFYIGLYLSQQILPCSII